MSIAIDTLKSRCHPSCRTCVGECLLLQKLNVNGLGLAELQAACGDISVPFSCNACNLCAAVCNRRLNPGEVMRAWRAEVAGSPGGLPPALEACLTDQAQNLYTAYRRADPGGLCIPEPSPAETVFFPGCALTAYTPELAQAAFDDLRKRIPALGWLDGCCYDLLDTLGLEQRYARAQQSLAEEVAQRRVRRMITACPICHYRLARSFPDVQVVSIYPLLAGERRTVTGLPARIAVHDSCADRMSQELGGAVRALLPQTVKLKHEGKRSLCCGAGGAVSFTDPELAGKIARRRWAEVTAVGAELLVTYCARCAVQLAQTSPGAPVAHILGLVYGLVPDFARVATGIQNLPGTEA